MTRRRRFGGWFLSGRRHDGSSNHPLRAVANEIIARARQDIPVLDAEPSLDDAGSHPVESERPNRRFKSSDRSQFSVGARMSIGPLFDAGFAAGRRSAEQEIERLKRDCAELYQVIGTMAEHCPNPDDPAIVKALDNASDAAAGDPRRHDDLLPFVLPARGLRR